MTLRWLPSYDQLIEELKATSGTMATAQLTINANSPTPNQTIIDRVEDVCTLLSLGAGNQVTWIEIREYSATGNLLTTTYKNNVTRSFLRMPVIAREDGSGLQRLVECGLPNLHKWDTYFATPTDVRPLRNAIRLAFDARTEQTYLQSRTLSAVIVTEMLASKTGG